MGLAAYATDKNQRNMMHLNNYSTTIAT